MRKANLIFAMYALHIKMREIKWPEKQYCRVKALIIKKNIF
jgi:hypothetical protein